VRAVLGPTRSTALDLSFKSILFNLQWLRVKWRIKFKLTVSTSKARAALTPPQYVHSIVPQRSFRSLHSNYSDLLIISHNSPSMPGASVLQPQQSETVFYLVSGQLLPIHPSDVTLNLRSSNAPSWIHRFTSAPLIHFDDHVCVTSNTLHHIMMPY
jgi:hypothetical protein